jgi:uncharacterized protein (DUF488 family)
MKRTDVYSIGYEGVDVKEFLRKLQTAGIGIVADVRAMPLSRKPGFSKNVLAAKLEKAGILYVHLKSCGNPDRASAAKYLAHLKKGSGVFDLQKLISGAGKRRIAVLCFERDPEECHRSLLLEALGRNVTASHL